MGALSLHTISPEDLVRLIGSADSPVILDVRRAPVFAGADTLIPTAVWRDPAAFDLWATSVPTGEPVVVYCIHGHNVSELAVSRLRLRGVDARQLAGGIDGYAAAGGVLAAKAPLAQLRGSPSRWVTRARPKIDRIACPWLIRRFIDRDAEIHYVSADWVREVAEDLDAIPFDVPEVAFTHEGERCSFDTFLSRFGLARFGLEDPALRRVAEIVRGADTARPDLAPEAAGLLAMSLGLSASHADDHAMLAAGCLLYDALYAWARYASAETHNWPARTEAAQ